MGYPNTCQPLIAYPSKLALLLMCLDKPAAKGKPSPANVQQQQQQQQLKLRWKTLLSMASCAIASSAIPNLHLTREIVRKSSQDIVNRLQAKFEEVEFKLFRGEMCSTLFASASRQAHAPVEVDKQWSNSPPFWSAPGVFNMADWLEACIPNKRTLGDNDFIKEWYFAHQRMASFGFPMAVVTNVLMFSLPFEAMAESCEPSNISAFDMPLLLGIALIGATVGGLLARRRRGELKRLNDQLRQINAALRRQAKIESYAPNLSYAPVGRILETEVIVDSRKQQLISSLKAGKTFLRNQEPEKAFEEFKAALELAQRVGDPIEEKKAARGLGASLQRLGRYRDAIKYHSLVLAISEREGEDSGNTEAYGAIADCYTELGDLEGAGKFYDKYIARLQTD
ncbi:hypothetical protein ACLOJK_039799 [Asimina triloba]